MVPGANNCHHTATTSGTSRSSDEYEVVRPVAEDEASSAFDDQVAHTAVSDVVDGTALRVGAAELLALHPAVDARKPKTYDCLLLSRSAGHLAMHWNITMCFN